MSLGTDGVLTAGAGAALGTATLAYRICQTGAPTNRADGSVALTLEARLAVSGRVVDGLSGAPLPGVRVALGARTATSDAQGQFSVSAVQASPRAVLTFNGAGYSENARIITVGDNGASGVPARLVPVSANGRLDASVGGTVGNAAGTARVVLPAAGLARADGSVVTGNASVSIAVIDPSLDSTLMPGDFTTIRGGNAVPIESFSAISVQIADAVGQPVNLRTGQTATIRIPLGSRSASAPPTIPLFFFDMAAGRWQQEGSATLQGTGAARYYEGTVTHFSVWNADSNTLRATTGAADITLGECLVLVANANGVSIKLTWGTEPSELGSHLRTPSGSHVYFSSKGQLAAAPFANLDVDDTSSYGPEVITLTKLMVGTYK
ncbi:carboxypeptidase regulatory-like domain-containing protein [Roseateles sp. DC23W]|uniref:Carboxypeptidase regulatory-like domain-containing protein n=1 Tax=Pelomonas dachongensis TaxID=3299029 RepID=A0ABW7ER56_9BURK